MPNRSQAETEPTLTIHWCINASQGFNELTILDHSIFKISKTLLIITALCQRNCIQKKKKIKLTYFMKYGMSLNSKSDLILAFFSHVIRCHVVMDHVLTHLSSDKMAAISQTIFSDSFSWMKSFVLWLKFHWSLFLWVQLTTNQHWFK